MCIRDRLVEDSVAIVGSRASTAYGDTVASDLGAELSEAGRTVLSGGAYGIDAAAHRGCLAGRSPTIAVLAGGLDLPYPSGHRPLFDRIATTGVLVSELAPGEHPTRVRFLARNRLIAALTPGTVLVLSLIHIYNPGHPHPARLVEHVCSVVPIVTTGGGDRWAGQKCGTPGRTSPPGT